MRMQLYSVQALPNGYWRADVLFSDDITVHAFHNDWFHDRAEAEAWVRQMESTMDGKTTSDIATPS